MKRIFIGFDARGRKVYLDFANNPHLHVIGSTRTGKSKLIEWIIRQIVKGGEGFCLIDPHGFLYDDVVKWCCYHNLLDRNIILLNPSEGDYVMGFNPFQRTEADLAVQVDNQTDVILRAWGATNTDETPSLDNWLHNILETIIESEETISVSEYLVDFYETSVRKHLTATLTRQITKHDWQGTAEAKTTKQFLIDHQILSSKNRIKRFLNPQMCRFMGMKHNNIDIGKIMEEGHILLVNLKPSDQLSKSNSDVFGALLVNEFFQQAFRRKRNEFGDAPTPFYLIIDEFQNFVKTPQIADMLDQLGKYGLRLILAHQRLGQISRENEDIVDAIFSNIKNRAIFGGLTRETAQYVVENCFVNQLDLRQIKKAIYQTKFWPVYGRDNVYAKTRSYSTTHSDGSTSNSAKGKVMAPASTLNWFEDAIGMGPFIYTENETSGGGAVTTDGYSVTDAETEIDTPIFYPVPFQELSNMEYWNKDEQVWKMSEALMAQLLRHCFIQIPGEETQPMLVPFVKEFNVQEEEVLEYQRVIYDMIGAKTRDEVEQLVNEEKKKLEQKAETSAADRISALTPQSMRQTSKVRAKVDKSLESDEVMELNLQNTRRKK